MSGVVRRRQHELLLTSSYSRARSILPSSISHDSCRLPTEPNEHTAHTTVDLEIAINNSKQYVSSLSRRATATSHHINNSQFIHLRASAAPAHVVFSLSLPRTHPISRALAGAFTHNDLLCSRMMKKYDKVINALLNIFLKRRKIRFCCWCCCWCCCCYRGML